MFIVDICDYCGKPFKKNGKIICRAVNYIDMDYRHYCSKKCYMKNELKCVKSRVFEDEVED